VGDVDTHLPVDPRALDTRQDAEISRQPFWLCKKREQMTTMSGASSGSPPSAHTIHYTRVHGIESWYHRFILYTPLALGPLSFNAIALLINNTKNNTKEDGKFLNNKTTEVEGALNIQTTVSLSVCQSD
jgi:hypothetical protein